MRAGGEQVKLINKKCHVYARSEPWWPEGGRRRPWGPLLASEGEGGREWIRPFSVLIAGIRMRK